MGDSPRVEDLLQEIERALRAKGMSAHQASIEAVGNGELVKRMRRGEVPTLTRFRELCSVLDLEFFVGPRRDPAPVDEVRLQIAVETTEKAVEVSGATVTSAERAKLQVALYGLIGREGAGAARIRTVLELLAQGKGD